VKKEVSLLPFSPLWCRFDRGIRGREKALRRPEISDADENTDPTGPDTDRMSLAAERWAVQGRVGARHRIALADGRTASCAAPLRIFIRGTCVVILEGVGGASQSGWYSQDRPDNLLSVFPARSHRRTTKSGLSGRTYSLYVPLSKRNPKGGIPGTARQHLLIPGPRSLLRIFCAPWQERPDAENLFLATCRLTKTFRY
jgi:hypothetical protein